MDIVEYRKYYIRLIVTILGPAVKREAANEPSLAADTALIEDLENKINCLRILSLISLIESNFFTEVEFKSLRKFQKFNSTAPVPPNLTHLSCFIYIRDCFGHNPSGKMFPNQPNTLSFTQAVASGVFPWAVISGDYFTLSHNAVHELHLIVLRLFGEVV